MPGGRKHKLNNLDDPSFNPLDPACTSDPACWLPVSIGNEFQAMFIERTQLLKHAPTYRNAEFEVGILHVEYSEQQEIDNSLL